MKDNERKEVSTLTDDELRREIAEALGHTFEQGEYPLGAHYRITTPDGKVLGIQDNRWSEWVHESKFCEVLIWPTDAGAAVELIRDVVDRLNVLEKRRWHTWTLSYALGGFMLVLDNDDDYPLIEYDATGETARALSELAALALRQMGGDDPSLS